MTSNKSIPCTCRRLCLTGDVNPDCLSPLKVRVAILHDTRCTMRDCVWALHGCISGGSSCKRGARNTGREVGRPSSSSWSVHSHTKPPCICCSGASDYARAFPGLHNATRMEERLSGPSASLCSSCLSTFEAPSVEHL